MSKHRLVTIGDSITQGVRSGAIVDGGLAWPSFLASAMGQADFSFPTLATERFGLPVNLEYCAREVLRPFGSGLSWWELPRAALRTRSWMDDVEDRWEDGALPDRSGGAPDHYHNLGILGFDLRDALSLTAAGAAARIPERRRDDVVFQVPEAAGMRVAHEVLRAAGQHATVFDAAGALADDGGIDVLVVMLGSNNALGVASELELVWSEDGFDDLDRKEDFTLWRPEHFAAEYAQIVDAAARVGAQHTVLATVPKVTIAPIARGVGDEKLESGSRYFEYYTRPWIEADDFDPRRDKHITHVEARAADDAIDDYNATIVAAAEDRGWHVFPLSALLDSMATRRYLTDESAQPDGFVPYPWPPPLDELDPPLATTFFESTDGRRTSGGIFSLDGIHPTVVASGLIAHEMAELLRADVAGIDPVDLAAALAADELNTDPPDIVGSALGVIGWLDQVADVVTGIVRLGR